MHFRRRNLQAAHGELYELDDAIVFPELQKKNYNCVIQNIKQSIHKFPLLINFSIISYNYETQWSLKLKDHQI
jgi:hypothetical protein